MTTATPTHAALPDMSVDDVQIVRTPPTIADAQLIVQLAHVDAVRGAGRGFSLLEQFETPPTLGQLRKRHPVGSQGWEEVSAFLMSCETMATFVRQGLLNESLVQDLYWIEGAWRCTEKLAKGLRREGGESRLFENFEWLAKRTT